MLNITKNIINIRENTIETLETYNNELIHDNKELEDRLIEKDKIIARLEVNVTLLDRIVTAKVKDIIKDEYSRSKESDKEIAELKELLVARKKKIVKLRDDLRFLTSDASRARVSIRGVYSSCDNYKRC